MIDGSLHHPRPLSSTINQKHATLHRPCRRRVDLLVSPTSESGVRHVGFIDRTNPTAELGGLPWQTKMSRSRTTHSFPFSKFLQKQISLIQPVSLLSRPWLRDSRSKKSSWQKRRGGWGRRRGQWSHRGGASALATGFSTWRRERSACSAFMYSHIVYYLLQKVQKSDLNPNQTTFNSGFQFCPCDALGPGTSSDNSRSVHVCVIHIVYTHILYIVKYIYVYLYIYIYCIYIQEYMNSIWR